MAAPVFGKTITQQATGTQSATCFILHGLGDSGEGLSHIGPALRLPHVKFVYPTAPIRAITINGGAQGTGWFDIKHPDLMGVRDTPAITASVEYVNKLLKEEIANGTPADRIVVGGFSQGGHISLRAATELAQPIAGIVALSTWCERPTHTVTPPTSEMPIFVGHGAQDPLVPIAVARQTAEGFKSAGFSRLEFHSYSDVGHSTSPQELQDLRSFLLRAIPDKLPTSDEVEKMSVKELRQFLSSRGIATNTFIEKSEFVARAKQEVK